MPLPSRYPEDWNDLALAIKKKAHWTCAKCKRRCLEPGQKVPQHWTYSMKMAYTLQVHHWDRRPENCSEDNLVAVCTGCHLDLHRGGLCNVSVGQLSLFEL